MLTKCCCIVLTTQMTGAYVHEINIYHMPNSRDVMTVVDPDI